MENFTAVSYFAGAGGFDIGFINQGFDIVMAYEWDASAVKSYRHNIGEHIEQVDITTVVGSDVPTADVWIYGFPCQDLSKNGNMEGLIEGKRSSMFFQIMRLLDEVEDKPSILLAENVRGLDKYFDVLAEEYAKRGYKMYHTLYNSKYWGVPQNRERYFVVGVHESYENEFKFKPQGTEITKTLSDILEDTKEGIIDSPLFSVVNGELRIRQATKQGYIVANVGDSVNYSHPKSKTRRGRVGKQIAQTLLTSCEQGVVLPDKTVRKFTPREYARIQTFPDSFEQVVSDNQFYKQIGNAVSVNVAEVVASAIHEYLTTSKRSGFYLS